ncbi:MAG: hypothetical protein KKA64_02350 [Nanoarchaeota archaeon]|nr:hypothetical protein [Nanoarchaeota archaeon]
MLKKRGTRACIRDNLNQFASCKRSTPILTSYLNGNLVKSKRSARALTSNFNIKDLTIVKSKRSQITLFVIIAIIIVAVILLFFLLRGGIIPEAGGKSVKNPEAYIDSCIKPHVEEAVEILLKQGGSINNTLYREFKFEGENEFQKISYLCYTQNNYASCINQQPMLIQHLKEEIKNYIENNVKSCFQDLETGLKNEGYEVSSGDLSFDVELLPKKIVIEMNKDLTISKSGKISHYQKFNIVSLNNIYDLTVVAQEIISQEARFCNFEQVGYMIFYPQFEISKFRTGDSTIIYSVEHRKSKERIDFAVRTCVIPPGIG